MLSRVADSIYWMSRYLERASSLARFMSVNFHLMLDLPKSAGDQWLPLVSAAGDEEEFFKRFQEATRKNVIQFLTLDREYGNSILSTMIAARENARAVRDRMPAEMWEEINSMYHMVLELRREREYLASNPFEAMQRIRQKGSLVNGLAHEYLPRGELHRFFQLGRNLERADKTSRLLDVKYFLLLPSVNYVGTPYEDIQWVALLRSLGGFQVYRQRCGQVSGQAVLRFLVLDEIFPGSIRFCLSTADYHLRALSGTPQGTFRNEADKTLGQLCAELSYLQAADLVRRGLHEFVDDLQARMNRVDSAIGATFFSPREFNQRNA